MGTMLQAAGLPLGGMPEVWNVTHPEEVQKIHRAYVSAGSRVIYANTFGANRFKAAGSGCSVSELVSAGVRCARAAAAPGCRVALDIGPLGQLLEPLGTLSFEEAYAAFAEMLTAGAGAGADLVVFETMSDLQEVRAGVLAAKETTSLPVWVTMTFEATGRTFLGTTVPAMALTLTGLGVDALGFNCSLGPGELLPLVRELRQWTALPLIFKPNAGLPDPATGAYAMTPEAFREAALQALPLGVRMLGGCCGSTPDFIRALRDGLPQGIQGMDLLEARNGLCSARQVAEDGHLRIIGERINPTGKKRLQQALREGDLDYVLSLAAQQQEAGAELLDVNVGLPGLDEKAAMVRTVQALQGATDLPLQIDSSDPEVIEAALRIYCGKALVNSVNGTRESLERILPLCRKYGAAVVGLCLDENGIPESWQGRVEIARRIVDAAEALGIPRQDLYIDCLTLTVSAQQEQARETLQALMAVRRLGVHTLLGVSNISFGMPERENITVSFLTQALMAGLECPIVNPGQPAIRKAIAAFQVLSGQDPGGEKYIRLCSEFPAPQQTAQAAAPAAAFDANALEKAMLQGQGGEVARLIRAALETSSEMEIIDGQLIPALNRVGAAYEKQQIFLPQLLRAAQAASQGFELLKERLSAGAGAGLSRGKILLATVRGDIHDIGKNIVRVVLENYGYTVLDLGRDVPPGKIVETVLSENIPLVGLSALMTTTLPSMAETIRALREAGADCKIMVGGAVLTPEYAAEIGADYYARDAKASADIAGEVLG
ncbi:MAG: homocysteine S-methyltransferase family protein [Clostridia bacterium]|nr:homocysteine S-methyltransferase family protein [Clostridia bacterium]